MENVEIKGAEILKESEVFELNKEIEGYAEKINWRTKSDFALKLVIKANSKKTDDKDNKRRRYSLQAQIKGETHSFQASSEDWDFNKAVHQVFNKLLNEIEHFYHSSEQSGVGRRK